MTPKRLYLLLAAACLAGYLYLIYSAGQITDPSGLGPCMFKNVTGVPCPSCGSTRAVLAIWRGDAVGALLINPLGLLLAVGLAAVPMWMAFDLASGKRTLHRAWGWLEGKLRVKWISALVIILIVLNWIWNIYKNV